MDSFKIESPVQQNAPQNNENLSSLKNDSVILLILGIFFFIIGIRMYITDFVYIYMVVVFLYIFAGVFGFIGAFNESILYMKIFRGFIYAIIVINAIGIILTIILCIYLFTLPVECTTVMNGPCWVIILLEILCFVTVVLSSLIIYFLFKVIKRVKRFGEAQESCRFVNYS